MRDLEIVSGELSPAWVSVIGGRRLTSITFAEVAPTEETVALLAFVDGSYEVGLTVPLEPYSRLVLTDDRRTAHNQFWKTVRELADDEE